MAWDRHETIYHLTPRGWEFDDPPPPDRVESWRCYVHQQSGWSKEYVDWTCIWANPDVPRTERDQLREKHKETMGTPDPLSNMVISIGEPF